MTIREPSTQKNMKEAVAKKAAEKKASRAAAKKAPAAPKAAARKPVIKKAEKPAHKTELYIQSPYGGEITPEQVLAKIPKDADACYVRVDQNRIWWVHGEEYGSELIW